MPSSQLFRGLRILEFAGALAGPVTGTFFKELGAVVTKLEPPGGDVSRTWRSPAEDPTTGASWYYCSVNGAKTVRQINLKEATGQEEAHQLIRDHDIILTNFTHEQAVRYGLDYATMKEIREDIILGNVTGYGPESDRRAFDLLLQAETGYLSMTGPEGGPPCKVPLPIIDILAAHQLKEGLLCALIQRGRTGAGTEVQVSLYDSALSALANQGSRYLMGGEIPAPLGTKHPSIAPYGEMLRTRDDQWIILAIGSDRQFAALCQVLDATQLSADPRFSTNRQRVVHRQHLEALLAPYFRRRNRDAWVELLDQQGIPAGSVLNMEEVFQQPAARQMIIEEPMPDGTLCKRMRTVVFL